MTSNLDELDLAGRASGAALQDLATLPHGTTTFLESRAIVGVHLRGCDSGGAPESWLRAYIDGRRSQALPRAIEISPVDVISRSAASRNGMKVSGYRTFGQRMLRDGIRQAVPPSTIEPGPRRHGSEL